MENVKMNYETLQKIERQLGRKLTDKEAVFGYQNGAPALIGKLVNKLLDVLQEPADLTIGNFDFATDEPCEEEYQDPMQSSIDLVLENMPASAQPWIMIAKGLMDIDAIITAYVKAEDHPITIDEEVGDILDIIKDQTVETLAKKLKETHEKMELPKEILDEVCDYLWNKFNNVSVKIVNGVIEVH